MSHDMRQLYRAKNASSPYFSRQPLVFISFPSLSPATANKEDNGVEQKAARILLLLLVLSSDLPCIIGSPYDPLILSKRV